MESGPGCEAGGSVESGPGCGVLVSCSVGTTSSNSSGTSRFVTLVGANSVSLKTSRLYLHQTINFLIRLL